MRARGPRPQPAPSRPREVSPAAAGPREKLSRWAGRRGRGGAAYRVRRAGRQAAARPTAASWCRRRRRRRSLPAGGPAGSCGTARRRVSTEGPLGEASRSTVAGAPRKSTSGRCRLHCCRSRSRPASGSGGGVPGRAAPPRPQRRSPRHGHHAWSRPQRRPAPFPPSAPAPRSPDPTRRRLQRWPSSSSSRPYVPSPQESPPLTVASTTALKSLT